MRELVILAGAASPLVVLLVLLMVIRVRTVRAAFVSWILAVAVAVSVFGAAWEGVWYSSGKGLALALFVVLIIWSAVLLYNVVKHAGAVMVIGDAVAGVTGDPLHQILLLAWAFASFIQGIAGFGVPVAVVAPLLTGIGFKPVVAASAVLVGHAWSVTFGSMASSFFSLRLVVAVPAPDLAFWLGILFLAPILLCGLSVAHMYGGFPAVKRGIPAVFAGTGVMGGALVAVTRAGMFQVGTLGAGAAGVLVVGIVARLRLRGEAGTVATLPGVHGDQPRLAAAVAPYVFLVVAVTVSQIPALRELLEPFQVGFSFPALATSRGYHVPAVTGFAALRLFGHPAPFLLAAALAGTALFSRTGHLSRRQIPAVLRDTMKQCVPATMGIAFMVMMALVMNDSGMTSRLAAGAARLTGRGYPLFSPLIGVLGSVMTGSNTNSNVLFGAFQEQVALELGVSAAVLAAAQSVGGSLGSSVAPAKALLGAVTVGISGQEGAILRNTLLYCILAAVVTGVIVVIVVSVV